MRKDRIPIGYPGFLSLVWNHNIEANKTAPIPSNVMIIITVKMRFFEHEERSDESGVR